MDDSDASSLEQIRAFLAASGGTVRFAGQRREEVYNWTERSLVRQLANQFGGPLFRG